MRTLTLGYSPCPNDTFIFHALTHGKIPAPGLDFEVRHEDVETLNRMALGGELDITKVSYGAIMSLMDNYCLLRSGGALGRGCGPLVVAREGMSLEKLRGGRIAVPGLMTTAYLLLSLFDPELVRNATPMQFDRIMPAVAAGEFDAGLVIHEGRFTYRNYGLIQLMDLGQWWESATGRPIPLGGILMKRSLGAALIGQVEALIRESILYARAHPDESISYIKQHSQELSDDVIERHIALYVNDYSVDVGPEGEAAVSALFEMAASRGLIARSGAPLFLTKG